MNKTSRFQLSEIASLITKGTTPTTIGYEFQENGINFLKIECFDEYGNYMESKVAHISSECHEKLKRSQLKPGDILFSIAGAIGRVAIVTDEMLPANTNQALAIIRITREDVYLPYIKLILSSPLVKGQFEKKKQGVAQLNISLKDINELTIPLPDIDEQIALTVLFEKAGEIIAKRQQQLSALDDLIKARFVEMFGNPFDTRKPNKWPQKTIRELAVNISDGSNVDQSLYKKHGDVLFLRIQNIWCNEFRLEDSVYISKDENERYMDTSLKHGDLLITKIGRYYTVDSSLGRVSVYLGDDNKANYSNNIMRVRFNDEVNSKFVNALMNLDDYNQFIRRTSVGGTDKRALSKSLIAGYPILVPPIEKQNEYVNYIHQIDKSKSVIQKSLDETQLLFDSLMQKYFG